MAKTQYATVHHLVDKRFVGISPSGQRIMIDGESEHPTGMRPMELVLNAVGSCAAYDVVEMLKKRRLEIRGYTIDMTGERQEGTPSGYSVIKAVHRLDVPGLDEKTARRFASLAMEKYCSVAASLTAEIGFEVELIHEAD